MEQDPSVQILVKNQKTNLSEEVKVYNGKEIFLKDGDYFQLRFFNPLDEKIAASIEFNNKKEETLLVLNPGQKSTIDRFLDSDRKMIFETYLVDDNDEKVEEAIKNNGIVKIKFYKQLYYSNISVNELLLTYPTYPIYSYPISGNINTTFTNDTTFETENNNFYSCCVSEKETGIVSKGEKSNQEFKNDYSEFEFSHFHEVSYNLKPMSNKPKEVKKIRQYCPECRYRLRKPTWKFCPNCGGDLI
jgi:hypothetical protein